MYQPLTDVVPASDPNRLGLAFQQEANRLPWRGPIYDIHTHLFDVAGAVGYCEAADHFGVTRTWSMTPLEQVDAIRERFGDRIQFIAVPRFDRRDDPDVFKADWIRRIEEFAEKGCRIVKFWAAPRGLDFSDELALDTPMRRQTMSLARSLGMAFMTHVADPDTWFATKYADHRKYGRKDDHYTPLRRLLDIYHDVPWIAAHMGGSPENLDRLQRLLDSHGNLVLDTSATKWMVRELSRRPDELADFCRRNPGRILFGTDLVCHHGNVDYDLYASRFWALRTLFETDYAGPSPIVDPDLPMVDPTLDAKSTATLRGANLDPTTLASVYHRAHERRLSAYFETPHRGTEAESRVDPHLTSALA